MQFHDLNPYLDKYSVFVILWNYFYFIYLFLIARTRKPIRVRPLATARSSDSFDETCPSTSPWIRAGRGGRRVSAARHVNPRARKRRGCDRVLPVRCHLVLPLSLNNSHLFFPSDSERYPSTLASLRYRTEKKIKVRRRGGPGANLWEKPVSVLTYLFFQA